MSRPVSRSGSDRSRKRSPRPSVDEGVVVEHSPNSSRGSSSSADSLAPPQYSARERLGLSPGIRRAHHGSVGGSGSRSPLLPATRLQRKQPTWRSQSCRKPSRRHLEVPRETCQKRRNSLPDAYDIDDEGHISDDAGGEFYRVRNFTVSRKGLFNRGDSYKRRVLLPQPTLGTGESSDSVFADDEPPVSPRASPRDSRTSSTAADRVFRVAVLGTPGVGRMSLVRQFTTSEDVAARGTHSGNKTSDLSVSVLLDGRETEMQFVTSTLEEEKIMFWNKTSDLSVSVLLDGRETEMQFVTSTLEECRDKDVDAYIVVYAIADKCSFQYVSEILQRLRQTEGEQCAIILVGNKSDLARTRVVSTDAGKKLASIFNCKFIETSAVLNHHVDELLVGTLSQINRREMQVDAIVKRDAAEEDKSLKEKNRIFSSLKAAKGLLNKLLRKGPSSNSSTPSDTKLSMR
ncbi:GTP-binding protein REM 1-like [Lingula anatina]|uniref:GTP-binding protein REM 1-like n=1 Tax=Lingula anatina TaxID=7574 RepID=A0A1S3HLQ9_LINAN|nr:GTP-binding protein REM 1-like [Lingula anatina]|eukprot:XP_013387038.1 GTP-binding protein REM 1-like [Lingula anatina]